MGAVCEICGDHSVGCVAIFLVRVASANCAVRDDISSLLSKAGSSLTVKILLDTLQQTTEFELSIAKKWATSVCLFYSIFFYIHRYGMLELTTIFFTTELGRGDFEEHISSVLAAAKDNVISLRTSHGRFCRCARQVRNYRFRTLDPRPPP